MAEPDFTRPVTVECLLCHSGQPQPVANSINRYRAPVFAATAISCERCHGPSTQHLRRPAPGSIVNPAKLPNAERDSVCEQCHLSGVVRILNPGKTFSDFAPGESLEQVYTVYRRALPPGIPPTRFKVISHPEQLAASMCARKSNGKLWCGTCHDPHEKPTRPVSYYRDRCLSCHAGQFPAKHPASNTNCVGCHMPRRKAFDGGHTVFTDHRIVRQPATEVDSIVPGEDLVAWREPLGGFAQRNLGLAYLTAGLSEKSPALIVRGYRMLTEIQAQFPGDPAILGAFGTALLLGKQPCEAKIAFDQLVRTNPMNPANEENAGRAEALCGDVPAGVQHLERALDLDPLLLSAAGTLEELYRQQGDIAKQTALQERMRKAFTEGNSQSR
ncbi:MAG TPA: hypothetical protein VHZ55_20355 [Bryobacteraceae bacterium]|nr:hypothetical protein [Bryobacteraceae bacterium]